jgi:Icc-related predicted phosphoesterase
MRLNTLYAITGITAILLSCSAHAPVGNGTRFEFAFCGDIHFACNHGDEQLKKSFNAWRKQLESIDFLVVAGDLTCDGAEEEFILLQEFFKSLKKPVYTLPGNHDLMLENVENDLLYRKYFSKGFGSSYVEHHGIGLLFLDFSDGGKASVSVSEETAQWLAKKMARVSIATPIIVFSHFPLHPSTPEYAVRRSDRIFSIIDQKNVIGYLSGHYHAWWSMERGGVPFYTVGTLLPAMNNFDTSDNHGYYKVAVLGNELKVEYVELVDKNMLIEPVNESGDEVEHIEGGEDLFRK